MAIKNNYCAMYDKEFLNKYRHDYSFTSLIGNYSRTVENGSYGEKSFCFRSNSDHEFWFMVTHYPMYNNSLHVFIPVSEIKHILLAQAVQKIFNSHSGTEVHVNLILRDYKLDEKFGDYAKQLQTEAEAETRRHLRAYHKARK